MEQERSHFTALEAVPLRSRCGSPQGLAGYRSLTRMAYDFDGAASTIRSFLPGATWSNRPQHRSLEAIRTTASSRAKKCLESGSQSCSRNRVAWCVFSRHKCCMWCTNGVRPASNPLLQSGKRTGQRPHGPCRPTTTNPEPCTLILEPQSPPPSQKTHT